MSEMDVENVPPTASFNKEALIIERARLQHRIDQIDKILGTDGYEIESKSDPPKWDVRTKEGQIQMMRVECVGGAGIAYLFTWNNPILWTTRLKKEDVLPGQYDPYDKFKELTRLFAEQSPHRDSHWFKENAKRVSVYWIAKYRSKIVSVFRKALETEMKEFSGVPIIPHGATRAYDLFSDEKENTVFKTCWKGALMRLANYRANLILERGRIRKKRMAVSVSAWSGAHEHISLELEAILVRDTMVRHWKNNSIKTPTSKMITEWKSFQSTLGTMREFRKLRTLT